MSTVAEIEEAIRALSLSERLELLGRFDDEAWDQRIRSDASEGRFGALIAEIEDDIAQERLRPLNEVLDNA